ncbi:Prophage integrase IntZ [Geodia barretti]|uniref:Prophage integrase IntZ n=1 Tax=Geodia barretti TaxID=519541 RepID=A0AA35R628_GEOBA|nr:Prophage integrase IntZ [Geodia barretti]
MPTFSEAAHTVHEANKPRWRNGSHTSAWIQTLERHAFPKIGNKKIDTVSRTDVLTVLTPIWSTRPETGRRVRQRMRTIFRWAMANELIETNPAGEAIDGALPSMPKVKAHLRALPYQEVGSALETVDASQTSPASKRCLKFLILTAARSGEARGATGTRSISSVEQAYARSDLFDRRRVLMQQWADYLTASRAESSGCY